MIPNIKHILPLLESHPEILQGINRGIERETLRVQLDGNLVTTTHPSSLGSALTNKWVTTDYAEALLEFITPVSNNITYLINFLRDLHCHVVHKLDKEHERMWSLSMPSLVSCEENIKLAQYGNSNIGRLKTLYRSGLKYRYGSKMQIISGVHYNFSLPLNFWQPCYGKSSKEFISDSYLSLIRNYYRFGWVIPYLFGASPAISPSFLQGKISGLDLKSHNHEMLYLPFATSLRLSPLGYTSEFQKNLDINLNSLISYVNSLQKAITTPYDKYKRIGLKKEGEFIQINTNLLQKENEFYAPIRPKCVIHDEGESISQALIRKGIEYVEVRSLDINPFSPIGIDLTQIRFLDLFLLWCLFTDHVEMNRTELINIRKNWERVALYGRNPGQTISINNSRLPLAKIGKSILQDLKFLANILDYNNCNDYKDTCDYIINLFDDPKLTYSSRILNLMRKNGLIKTGIMLSDKYHRILLQEDCKILSQEQFDQEVKTSFLLQSYLEATDKMSFVAFLSNSHSSH
ncbi:MAG: glutamate--cysteine ligase [Candidatus Dasytiphilus stammeri]